MSDSADSLVLQTNYYGSSDTALPHDYFTT
jgi:hypothetical protein